MQITPYKTHIISPNEDLFAVLARYLPPLKEKSIVAIASKIVGICEGRVVTKESEEQKDAMIKEEAEYYLSEKHLGFFLTINQNMIVVNAGIDESNSNGFLSLWPKDPQKSTDMIRAYLQKKYSLKHIGVILTDSKVSPLRMGVTGYGLAHSGFEALTSYIGKPDIFGRKMLVEQTNVRDSLATAATLAMGEGAETQPLAVITDLPFVTFQDRNPTPQELESLVINQDDDVYAQLLTAVSWQKGKK